MKTITPRSPEEVAEEVARAARESLAVLPAGEGTRMDRGIPRPVPGLRLSTTGLRRVVQYEPADLTVTVEAGIGLDELDRVLGARGQFLPLQGPRRGGTVGGLLATAAEGALALRSGMPRDWLIGMRIALADGSLVKGGGRVVKTVAGYPIHRLMIGSHGTLGVIVEASFKVAPRPGRRASVLASFGSEREAFDAARLVLTSAMEPSFVNVLIGDEGGGAIRMAVGLDGSEPRVAAHVARIRDLIAPAHPGGLATLEAAEQEALRERLDDPASLAAPLSGPAARPAAGSTGGPGRETGGRDGDRVVIRAAVLPSRVEEVSSLLRSAVAAAGGAVAIDARPGLGTLYATLGGTDRRGAAAALDAARAIGSATVHAAPAAIRSEVDPWGPPPADFPLMQRVKQALDPAGTFLGGRFVGGL